MSISSIHLSDIFFCDLFIFRERVLRVSTWEAPVSAEMWSLTAKVEVIIPYRNTVNIIDPEDTVQGSATRARQFLWKPTIESTPRCLDFFKKGLSRAVPAVAQILTRREDAELRESGELCSGW